MVADCDVVLVIIGRRWVDAVDEQGRRRLDQAGDFVRLEVEAALRREIPVVPLLVDGAAIPQPGHLPESLMGLPYRNGSSVRYDPDFHADIDRLLRRLVTVSSPPVNPRTGGTLAKQVESPVTVGPTEPASPEPGRAVLMGHTDRVLRCAVAPDGTWVVSTSADKTLRIWDVATGQPMGTS